MYLTYLLIVLSRLLDNICKLDLKQVSNKSPILVVRKSKIGLGAFATSSIAKDEVIVDWTKHPLFQKPVRIPPGWKFTRIATGVYNGPIGPEHPDTYLNHSCAPNAKILFGQAIHLVASRDISAEEEVTFDYATLYPASWSMKCKCGEPACRKMIRGKG